MDVSVVIPTFNKAPFLDYTLASLFHQSYPRDRYEVIVVNDGSSDATAAVLACYSAHSWNLRIIEQQNTGRSTARNAALALAKGRVIIFVDDDIICHRDLIALHLACYPDELPRAVIGTRRNVFTRLVIDRVVLAGLVKGALFEVSSDLAALVADRVVGEALPPTIDLISRDDIIFNPDKIHALSTPTQARRGAAFQRIVAGEFACPWALYFTCNSSVSRSAVLAVGGFDENFQGWGEEDVELGYRLFGAGVSFGVINADIAYHQLHPVASSNRKAFVDNYIYFATKHPRPEIYLRWHVQWGEMVLEEYEAQVARILVDTMSAAELAAIEAGYRRFKRTIAMVFRQ